MFMFLPMGTMLAILLTYGSVYDLEDSYFFNADSALFKIGVVSAIELVLLLIFGVYA